MARAMRAHGLGPSAAARLGFLLVATLSLSPDFVQAQGRAPGPSAAERLRSIVAAFDLVASRAEAGAWQAADAAYNDAVAVADSQRPALIVEVGERAEEAMTALDALLPRMVAALDAEDDAAVRAVAGLVRSQLASVVPGAVRRGPPVYATQLVLGWRDRLDEAVTAGADGRWNDMRDGATDLVARMERRGASVTIYGDDASTALYVDVAMVFVLRVRAAALDRSMEDAALAAQVAQHAMSRLLKVLEGETTATATPDPTVRLHFRPFVVAARVGDVVNVPIVAEDIPNVGLGAFTIEVHWSEAALALLGVQWDVGQGTVDRGAGPGTVVLRLPPAPTGPSGSAIVARLQYQVVGSRVDVRHYLPSEELRQLEAAVAEANDEFLKADVPKAGKLVMDAYVAYAGAGDSPSELRRALDERALGEPLRLVMLRLLDALTRPAEADVIFQTFKQFEAARDATLATYAAQLVQAGQVPIIVKTRSVTDTRGRALPWAENPGGTVVLGVGSVPVAPGVPAAPGAVPPGLPVAGEVDSLAMTPVGAAPAGGMTGEGGTSEPSAPGDPAAPRSAAAGEPAPGSSVSTEPVGAATEESAATDGGTPWPMPLVAALLAAGLAGVAATVLATRATK